MDNSKIKFGLTYFEVDSPIHRLNGVSKFLLFIYWLSLTLLTFDLRILVAMVLMGFLLLYLSKVPPRVYKPFIFVMLGVVSLNALFIFLFSPNQGETYMGSSTVLLTISKRYIVTKETLWYLLVITCKYFTLFPMALLFVLCTHPTEFSASLSRIGVSYKVAYAVGLSLRYLPEVVKDFTNIMHAQQARGVDISKNVSLKERISNVTRVLIPLILTSLDKTDTISNAMELRGFGKDKARTWYNAKPIKCSDIILYILMTLFLIIYILMGIKETSGFWYPLK